MIHKLIGTIKKIHFIGVGGIGMSGIARILKTIGYEISGSDMKVSDMTNELKELGIEIFVGHKASNISNASVIVTSSAISLANPEIIEARRLKIPIIQRGEMLAELMRLKYGIAIAGTHGKTTTTALVTSVAREGGLSPTSVIGGKWSGIGSNAELGASDYLICEADESDGSFLKLSPAITIVTNIDNDHMDYYKTHQNLVDHFHRFISNTPFYGKAIVCLDNDAIRKIVSNITKPIVTYGLSVDADLRAENIHYSNEKMSFSVYEKNVHIGDFLLGIPGTHNVLNALAAIAVGRHLNIPIETIKKSLFHFEGVVRRMSQLGNWENFKIIDDYGHHPTEIKATLEALTYRSPNVIVIFQPHRYTRTLDLFEEFAESLSSNVSEVYIDEIYSAGENAIENVDSSLIADRVRAPFVCRLMSREKIIQTIKERNKDKSGIILTIGAGDVYKIGKELANVK